MNKIYKVIWSKVKNQYVVVSELAHSNGKQSRTSRNSIRSRIAALVVCGAIAAFGVFSALPMDSVYAAENVNVAKANEYQYVAIKTTDEGSVKSYTDSTGKTYTYHSEFINGAKYWVRDGYTIEQIEGKRFPEAQKTAQIQAIKSPNASTEGLLQSNRVLLSTPGQSTVLGDTLQKADVGVYMGATNEGGTKTPSSWNYYIQKNNGSYVDAGGANFDTYFVEAEKQNDGTYKVNGKTVSSENLYVINDQNYLYTNAEGKAVYEFGEDSNHFKLGAFVVDGQIYTKNVFGKYNEVLMSAQQGNTYYSYWAADTYDADAPMQLTQGQYKDIVDTMWGNDTYLASSDVSQVKVEQTTEPGKNGGTISLIQQGDYHEGVNGEDGYYENNKTVPGAITITSEGGIDGKDVAVKFANTVNGEESSFTVNAGSKVQGINNDEVVQGSNETTTTIDGLEINGQKYSFDSKTYTDGDGIKFEGTDDGTISVDLATNDEKENISGLHFKNGQLANNLSIEEATPVEGETHSNKGNWSIIEDTGDGTTKTFTNTTLDSTASETANEEAEENSTYVDKDTETSKVTTTYGRDYVVKDTDGNEVELKDIASASTLKDIDINKIGDLQYSEVINEEDPNYDPNTDLTIEDDDSLTVAVGKLDNRVTNNTTNINNLTETVNEGWTAQAGENSIKVTPKDGKNTLNFAGDNNITVSANEATSTIQVGLEDDITLDDNVENGNNVKLSGTNGTISAHNSKFIFDGTGNYDNANDMTFDQNGLTVTNTQTMKENDETTTSSTVINGGSITTGNVTAGGITVNADNGGTVNGLTNKTWDAENYISGQAATEDQLKEAVDDIEENDYDGWKVSANGVENGVDVTTGSTVDFSNTDGNIVVGQDGTNLTFDLAKDITLDDGVENGNNVQLSGTNGTISAHNSELIFGGTGNYDNANDMTFDQNGLTVTNTQTMKENDETTTSSTVINGGSITTGNVTAGGITVNADNGGTVNGLTNKTWDAENYISGQAATEDQLKEVVDDIEANDYDGWKVSANGQTGVDVTTGSTVDFSNTDGNVVVSQDGTNLTFDLAKDITLDDDIEDGNSVQLSGTNGTINAHNSELVFGGTGKYDNVNDMTFDQNGLTVTNTQTMRENGETTTSSTVINGGSIATGNITAGGITVNADNGGTVNGLTNKTWDADNYVSGQAATEDQLKEVVDDIEANDYDGWKVSANGQTGVDVTTGSTVDFSNTDGNVVVSQDGTNLTFDLAKDITLDDGIEGGNSVQLSGTNGTISAHNSELVFGGTGKYDDVNDMTFDQNGLTVTNTQTMRDTGETTTSSTVINGGSIATGNITAGGITVNADNGGTVNGLTNKTWDADNYVSGQAATEDQLQEAAAASKTTVSNGTNTTVTSVTDSTDGHVDYQVNLNDNVYLGGNRTAQNSNIKLDGEKGNIQVGSNIALLGEDGRAIIGGVDISTTFDDIGKKSATITGLSNTTWDADKVVIDRAATEGQLQMVSDKVTAGWTATDDNGNKINVNPDNHPTLNFASGKNITVSAVNDEVEVSLNDNINLNDRVYINGKPAEGNNTIVDIKSGDTSKEESIFAVEDKGNGSISIGGIDVTNVDGPYLAVGDGKLKFYKDGGLATGNETGTFSVRPDGDLEINGKNSSFNIDAETGNVNAVNSSGSAIMMNDDSVALNASGNGVAISDEGILLNTNSNGTSVSIDNRGTTFTNTNTGETTNINGDIITTDTVKGLSNTTWDDELATQVANSEELQGTAATQGQLQQAVSAVATEAAKQHTTVSGDDNLTVKSSVNKNGGTNYQVTLDDDITLGNPKAGNTEGERSFTINTTNPNGYVPESYNTGSGANFIEENGGFMLFATDTRGFGVFGVTAKGSAWAKDFKTYTTDIYGNNTQYSLNEIGDAVAQMSSYYNKENGKSYTVFSRYLNEAEKDNPFATVDENANRDIPLALRDDGAVLIGATIKGDDFTDNGIRINAETETTYDENGKEVTNNVATITGLENTEWKPPTPVATFAANQY